jgi:hypothetical protein
MFGNTTAYQKEFLDLWQTQVFEMAAMNVEQSRIAELSVNKASEIMMRKHGLSMPEMVRIIESSMKSL